MEQEKNSKNLTFGNGGSSNYKTEKKILNIQTERGKTALRHRGVTGDVSYHVPQSRSKYERTTKTRRISRVKGHEVDPIEGSKW